MKEKWQTIALSIGLVLMGSRCASLNPPSNNAEYVSPAELRQLNQGQEATNSAEYGDIVVGLLNLIEH
jgi:hypothetical protein